MGLSRRTLLLGASSMLLASCSSYSFRQSTRVPALTREIIIARVNEVRAAHGRRDWTYNLALAQAARSQAHLMADEDTLSHNLGVTLRERVKDAGYDGVVGENVAFGFGTLEEVLEGWLGSSGHRFTLLNDRFSEFGFSYKTGKAGKVYWALIAGGSYSLWATGNAET